MSDLTELLADWRELSDSVSGWPYSDSMEDEAFSRDAREPFARLLDAVQAVLDLRYGDCPLGSTEAHEAWCDALDAARDAVRDALGGGGTNREQH